MSINLGGGFCRFGGSEYARRKPQQAGFSLVEAVVFIVIVGVGLGGVLMAINTATRDSVDPLIRKQALAIAESLLQEIEAMPDTFCDPDDANVSTATGPFVGPGGCAITVEELGPEAGETRYSTTTPFDNVNDYNGFTMTGIRDISNTPITGLGGYTAAVQVSAAALGVVPNTEALLIAVTVTGPANTVVTVEGYRARYAPNL